MGAMVDQFIIGVILGAVLLVPGVPWLVLLRLDSRVLPIELVPAVLTVVTIVSVTVAETIALTIGLSLIWQVMLMLVVALGPVPWLVTRHRARLREFVRWRADRSMWVTAALAIFTGISAFRVGGHLRSDSLYHVAISVKLQALAHPSFTNIQAYADGGPHPGYAVPVFHALIAFVAAITGAHPSTVYLAGPLVLTTLALLTLAGSSVVIFGTRLAAPVGAVIFMLFGLQTEDSMYSIFQAGYPREISTAIAMPVALSAWLIGLRSTDRRTLVSAIVMMCAAITALVILHVSYIYLLAIWFAGYLLFWLVFGSVRSEYKRHVVVSCAAFAMVVATLGPLLPTLSSLDSFVQESTVEKVMVDNDLPMQPAGLKFGELFVGDKDGYHLRPDAAVWMGGLFMLGAVGAALTALLPFRRENMFLGGAMLLVLATVLSDTLFPMLVQAAGTSQARRIYLAVPAGWGLVAVVLASSWLLSRAWLIKHKRYRIGALILLVIGVFGVSRAASHYPIEHDVLHPNIPTWPLYASMAILAIIVIAGLVFRTRRVTMPARWVRMGSLPPIALGWSTLAATGLLLVGAWPIIATGAHYMDLRFGFRHWGPGLTHSGLSPTLRINSLLQRNDLDKQSIVLAPPDLSYRITASTPDYVVGTIPGHQANTTRNRVYERFDEVIEFYKQGTLPAKRVQLIYDSHVDVIVLVNEYWPHLSVNGNPQRSDPHLDVDADPALIAMARSHPQSFRWIGNASEYELFEVNRTKLKTLLRPNQLKQHPAESGSDAGS